MSSLEEKLRSVRSLQQEVQLHCSQQKQSISELQAKNSQQSVEANGLRRRTEELQQVSASSGSPGGGLLVFHTGLLHTKDSPFERCAVVL